MTDTRSLTDAQLASLNAADAAAGLDGIVAGLFQVGRWPDELALEYAIKAASSPAEIVVTGIAKALMQGTPTQGLSEVLHDIADAIRDGEFGWPREEVVGV